MKRSTKLMASIATAMALFGATPAHGADNGSIGATINIAPPPEACITLARATINFPSTALTPIGAAPTVVADPQQGVGITNCSTTTQTLFASTTAATVGTASWTPGVVNCTALPTQTDVFGIRATVDAIDARLTLTDAGFMQGFIAGSQRFVVHRVEMPCAGSSTGGATGATFNIRYTATI